MKKLSVLFLIAILGIVLWALPAGAEKSRMTDAEMDGITAGASIPTPGSPVWNCCAQLILHANGSLVPLSGGVSLDVTTMPINPSIMSFVHLEGDLSVPGVFSVGSLITGPKKLVVPLPSFVLPIP